MTAPSPHRHALDALVWVPDCPRHLGQEIESSVGPDYPKASIPEPHTWTKIIQQSILLPFIWAKNRRAPWARVSLFILLWQMWWPKRWQEEWSCHISQIHPGKSHPRCEADPDQDHLQGCAIPRVISKVNILTEMTEEWISPPLKALPTLLP